MFEWQSLTMTSLVENPSILSAAVAFPEKQRLHPRLPEGERQFMGAVGGIHIHQDRSRAGATQLHHHPSPGIGGQGPNAGPGADPARAHSERDATRQFAQFAPAMPFRLMTG